MEADEPSLYLRREKLALQYAIRLAAYPSNPANEITFPPHISEDIVNLYENKPNVIKSFGLRIQPLLTSAHCAPLVADLFLFCYERDFMMLSKLKLLKAFKSTSRYLDDLLNIDNPYFEGMVNRIYPPELQLNKSNTSDTEAPFLDLHLSISNRFVSSKIYDKRDDFDFDIVNFSIFGW